MAGGKYSDAIVLDKKDGIFPESVFVNLQHATRFALDIGGSLAKLVYISDFQRKRNRVSISLDEGQDIHEEHHLYKVEQGAETCTRLHFIKFETKYIENFLDFIILARLTDDHEQMRNKVVKATGGGAHKYTDLIETKLGCKVDKEDEMSCLIKGCSFLMNNVSEEIFIYSQGVSPEYRYVTQTGADRYPFLLVNIGSGVSMLKVESETQYERIAGTAMGGGTFWGLGSLLTNAKGFDELLELAVKGHCKNLDMQVKDIYGGAYTSLGLPGDLIASSFGKAARSSRESVNEDRFREEDIAKSLLHMISNDIGQIAYLNARLHGLTKVYFGGFFMRGNPVTMYTISYAINYWSKGTVQALFLRHEGYLGAIGAFLKGTEERDLNKYSWGENYTSSSRLWTPPLTEVKMDHFDMFALNQCDRPLVPLPYISDLSVYSADTVNLSEDIEARNYWLDCFKSGVNVVMEAAMRSQPNCNTVKEQADRFCDIYTECIDELTLRPRAHGSLSVRSLLDLVTQCLEEADFPDIYLDIKQQENEQALKLLNLRLSYLDTLSQEDRQLALIEGILTGNMFDWGTGEVTRFLKNPGFGFNEAKSKIQKRPWLVDDYERWVQRMNGTPHTCCLLFVDNSGIDIVLGVIPLARELLKRGTHVILAANSEPALNDVTFSELLVLIDSVSNIDSHIRDALKERRLVIVENGNGSPCLDLSRVDSVMVDISLSKGVDLVILEGMGRAIHTNFLARLSCETLKLAVIKNTWLAQKMGGELFNVVFKYEVAQ